MKSGLLARGWGGGGGIGRADESDQQGPGADIGFVVSHLGWKLGQG